MRNEVRNMDASVKARLKNIAKEYKKTFNLILQLYMQERLLYRLSVSEYKDNFILKGGLFLFSMSGFTGRPTRDIDFLAYQISIWYRKIKAFIISILWNYEAWSWKKWRVIIGGNHDYLFAFSPGNL